MGVDTVEGFEGTVLPSGAVAAAVAVLSTCPASTSGCVTVYGGAVHVVEPPGASVVTGHVTAPAVGSVTVRPVRVVVPVFVTRNDQLIRSVKSARPSALTSVTVALFT